MSVRLFDYNYMVQYLPGVKNTVADFLSRMPLPSKDTDEFQNTDEDGKEDMWVAIVEEGSLRVLGHRDVIDFLGKQGSGGSGDGLWG
ncbi:hypothetical protein NDU88_006512 [Pleurodeles waltl]|uniref:Uncharacterized protein n=1 Tax=Pleurodeles waltl TaxID=8319 RepID=A0AAV7PNP4_PLEWA|nr:hypothetical protein NDU88_006512 [Pleurodeles waltl]